MKTKSKLLQTRMLFGLALAVLGLSLVPATAADSNFSDANWSSMGGFPGANGGVGAAVVDGSGNLYIGGDFTFVGDVIANGIAKWDDTSWTELGAWIDQTSRTRVSALAVSGGDLYVGGRFTIAGGVGATNIAKWNGSSWSAVGLGMNGYWFTVEALAVSGNDVYAGGS